MIKLFYIGAIGVVCSCAGSNVVSIEPVKNKQVYSVVNKVGEIKFSEIPTENKAVAILNQLFNSDAQNKKMVLVIKNDSECDFVMQIIGNERYSVPVSMQKSESIVLERGSYVMSSEVCQMQYRSQKTFTENTLLSIKATVVVNDTNINSSKQKQNPED